jgi:hypothetical protein
MLFIFSTPVLIRHLWQLKTVVSLHWCLIHAVLFLVFTVDITNLKMFIKLGQEETEFLRRIEKRLSMSHRRLQRSELLKK